jgi:hypothetical protein
MTELARQALTAGLGLGEFVFAFWLLATCSLLVLVPLAVVATGPLVDPVAVLVALSPSRAARMALLAIAASALAFFLLVASWFGTPLAIALAVVAVVVFLYGYAGVCVAIGDRALRSVGIDAPMWLASIVGVVVLRVLRLVPVVGGIAHAAVAFIGFGAASAALTDKAVSWHRRRLPDEEQFAGERITEWDEVLRLDDEGRQQPPGDRG